jgi:hypothetical protein
MDTDGISPSIKFFFAVLLIIAGLSFFVPVMTNPNPTDCNNYPDGAGGYYLKCKDEHISLIKKWKLPKDTPVT